MPAPYRAANLKTPTPGKSYDRVRSAIAEELRAGAENVLRSYREEIVRRTWNIGKLLRCRLDLGRRPGAENAAIVGRLSKDFGRPESFFYDAAKFHRLYPSKPPLALSWAHYALLIRVPDPRKRLALEQKAISEAINAKDMRLLTRLTDPLRPGSGSGSRSLMVERGQLYHYRAVGAPRGGRILVDIGFSIERDVRCNGEGSLHSGLIVRSVQENDDYSAKISPFDKTRLYTYAAELVRVVDGDTLIARVDLGFRTRITETFRLRGIDAPEATCAAGLKAKREVEARLAPRTLLAIKTYKQEKFGRFLADVFHLRGADDPERVLKEGAFLNQELLDEGLAEIYRESQDGLF